MKSTMLIRELKRIALILIPLLGLLLIISLSLWKRPQYSASLRSKVNDLVEQIPTWNTNPNNNNNNNTFPSSDDINETHQEISSISTPDGKYFPIRFGNFTAFNPNIIPHPAFNDTWIIVAQKRRVNPDGSDPSDTSVFHVEIGCLAVFRRTTNTNADTNTDTAGGVTSLECIDHPDPLPIAATPGSNNKCTGPLSYMSWNIGPHDARVFFGPGRGNTGPNGNGSGGPKPYIIFGSNSAYTCFGMFMQDFRVLMDWKPVTFGVESWRMATELQRPGNNYGFIEKNWFVFWDFAGGMYVHYSLSPQVARVFARVDGGGAAGRDLGPLVGKGEHQDIGEGQGEDEGTGTGWLGKGRGSGKKEVDDRDRDVKCMERYFPRLPRGKPEDIHQATNSLRVTLCNRRGGNKTTRMIEEQEKGRGFHGKVTDADAEGEAECVPDNSNTVIMTIVHHKTYYDYHGQYEPYVVLFRQRKPFELYGISQKPLWIRGRERQSAKRSDMVYVASVSWRDKGRGYQGYLDDVVFLGFGIEDRRSGGLDLTMGDLLGGIGLC